MLYSPEPLPPQKKIKKQGDAHLTPILTAIHQTCSALLHFNITLLHVKKKIFFKTRCHYVDQAVLEFCVDQAVLELRHLPASAL